MTERVRYKQAVRGAFDRAAASYDRAAIVQREICHRLLDFASRHTPDGRVAHVLDAGCGTGYGLADLAARFPDATLVALDFAPAMLEQLPGRGEPGAAGPLCADLEALPLATGSIDLAWSSLALQWCDPALALAELARVLRPGGAAWVATLGPETLAELRAAFALVDDAEHVLRFTAPETLLGLARQQGFTVAAHARGPSYALASDLRGLLRDIKAIGAHRVGAARRRAPLGREAWRMLEAAYEPHRRDDGRLPATYDVVLLALKKESGPDARGGTQPPWS